MIISRILKISRICSEHRPVANMAAIMHMKDESPGYKQMLSEVREIQQGRNPQKTTLTTTLNQKTTLTTTRNHALQTSLETRKKSFFLLSLKTWLHFFVV